MCFTALLPVVLAVNEPAFCACHYLLDAGDCVQLKLRVWGLLCMCVRTHTRAHTHGRVRHGDKNDT